MQHLDPGDDAKVSTYVMFRREWSVNEAKQTAQKKRQTKPIGIGC